MERKSAGSPQSGGQFFNSNWDACKKEISNGRLKSDG